MLLDQVLSSSSNLATFVAVAAATDAAAFGGYAIGSSLFAVALGATRTTSSERVALSRDRDAPHALTSSLALVCLAFIVGAAILTLVTDSLASATWMAAGPLTLLQDRLRFIALSLRPGVALASDTVWLACVVSGWALAVSADGVGDAALLVAAVLSPLAATALALVGLAGRIRWKMVDDRRHLRPETPYVVDGWLLATAVFVVIAAAGAFGSLSVAGQLRVSLLIYQPFFSLGLAGRWSALTSDDLDRVARWPVRVSALAAGYGLLVGLAILVADLASFDLGVLGIGGVGFALTVIGQTARAFHQGVADIARRSVTDGVIAARLAFAATSIALASVAASFGGTDAWIAALSVGFVVGAVGSRSTCQAARAALRVRRVAGS